MKYFFFSHNIAQLIFNFSLPPKQFAQLATRFMILHCTANRLCSNQAIGTQPHKSHPNSLTYLPKLTLVTVKSSPTTWILPNIFSNLNKWDPLFYTPGTLPLANSQLSLTDPSLYIHFNVPPLPTTHSATHKQHKYTTQHNTTQQPTSLTPSSDNKNKNTKHSFRQQNLGLLRLCPGNSFP